MGFDPTKDGAKEFNPKLHAVYSLDQMRHIVANKEKKELSLDDKLALESDLQHMLTWMKEKHEGKWPRNVKREALGAGPEFPWSSYEAYLWDHDKVNVYEKRVKTPEHMETWLKAIDLMKEHLGIPENEQPLGMPRKPPTSLYHKLYKMYKRGGGRNMALY